ncbi:helix-turn-helix domain-containing protein [uncultured Phascolarctobacterium sp.]|uniref:helix-turn-helix domain-containing protein n=1 Tax=uncultured Phascolarctobacterium sp. TaxID=512296 RepID=UPI0025D28742|nr:helix-turn-helix domain-containing protein [uncultured Phascolarctobacterium sp.]
MHKNFYTVKEFHKILGNTTCITSIYNQIKAGKIPVTYIGNRTLIPGYWVEEFCKMYKCTSDLGSYNG